MNTGISTLLFLIGFLGGGVVVNRLGDMIRCRIDTKQRIKYNLPLNTPYRRQQGWPLR